MTKPKRILAIAPQPFFTPRGTPLSVYYRTLVLAQSGVSVDLLTYGQGEDVDIPDVRIIRIPRFGIGRVKVGPSFVKAFLDVFMMIYTVALLMRRRYAVVHAHEESVFWCRFLKPIFRFRLVYDMHSSLPQQLTNFQFSTSRLLIGAFDRLERSCLRAADAVITICPELQNYALAHGVDEQRHFLIENSIFDDVRIVKNGRRRVPEGNGCQMVEPRSAAGQPWSKRSIVYAGTFEPYQGIELLIEAYARIAHTQPDVELVLVGGTAGQIEKMRRLACDLGVSETCCFLAQRPKREAMALMGSATVLVSPRISGTNTPLKVYEQLASGVPLVATRIRSHTQVLTDDVCILVDPNPQSFAAGLMTALQDDARRSAVVRAAKELYERKYSRAVYETKIHHCLAALS